MPFYNYNRPGVKFPKATIELLASGHDVRVSKVHYYGIDAFSETDLTEDLKKFAVPTLIMHSDDDQIVPIGASGHALDQSW